MKRSLGLLLCLMVLLAGVLPVSADGPAWSVWLYDAVDGRALLVGSDGAVISEVFLPVAQGFDRFPSTLAASPSGALLAFVITSTDTQERQLRVFDTASQSVRVAYNLPPLAAHSLDYRAEPTLYNEGEAALAFGYALDDGTWQVVVLDMRTGEATHVLRSDNPAVLDRASATETPLVPVVQRFRGDRVTFALAALPDQPQPPALLSYDWHITDDSVAPALVYTSLDHDTFEPTGEVILPAFNPDLPHAPETDDGANVLDVFEPTTYRRWPFYNEPQQPLFAPVFVQNGERILVGARGQDGSYTYQLIGRDGALVSQFASSEPVLARGLSDGYVGAVTDTNTNSTMLFYANTRDDQPNAIIYASDRPVRLVWAQDRRLVPFGPYPKWAELAEPVLVGPE